MGVNIFAPTWAGESDMSVTGTKTLSVRVPNDVYQWVNENGGSAMLKAVLYAHILTRTYGVNIGAQGKLLQSIIEAGASATLEGPKELEEMMQANISLE